MKHGNNIVEKIGIPAVLETCAEECSELGKACLKLSRKLRDEHPTPKTKEEIIKSLAEEIADVIVCIETITDETNLVDEDLIYEIADTKRKRWSNRIDKFLDAKFAEKKTELIKQPEVDKDILIKIKNSNLFEENKHPYTVGYYASDDTWRTADGDKIPGELVIDWRDIPE